MLLPQAEPTGNALADAVQNEPHRLKIGKIIFLRLSVEANFVGATIRGSGNSWERQFVGAASCRDSTVDGFVSRQDAAPTREGWMLQPQKMTGNCSHRRDDTTHTGRIRRPLLHEKSGYQDRMPVRILKRERCDKKKNACHFMVFVSGNSAGVLYETGNNRPRAGSSRY